jgi:ABC-2 type transport system permease protein
MKIAFTLLKLEFRNNFGAFSLKDKKTLKKTVGTAIFALAFYVLVLWASEVIFEMFVKEGLGYEILVFLFTGMFLFFCFTGVSSVAKVLYYKGDNEMLMRLPVKGYEVFISKTLYLIINQILVTAVVLVPVMFAYSRVVPVPKQFLRLIPAAAAFIVFIPFFISNLLAIPVMMVTNKIRHRYGLVTIIMAVSVTAMFTAYITLFQSMVTYLKGQSFSVFDPKMIEIFKEVALYCYPTKYFADLVLQKNPVFALFILMVLSVFLLFLVILLIVFVYQRTLLKNVEIEGSAYRKKRGRFTRRPIFFTLLKKEFLQVMRSTNYSFQYFVLACSMPVMVYFCNKIAIGIGKNDIGDKIILGLTLLVMLIFNTVIISFSATSITREGDNFYHTKVIPVSIRTQLLAKFTMYLLVSILANVVTIAGIVYYKQIPLDDAVWLYAIVQFLAVALTLRSMKMDVKRPKFNLSGQGELVSGNVNTTASVGIGFAVSVFLGILAMLISYLLDSFFVIDKEVLTVDQWMLLIISGISFIFGLYCILSYSINLKKHYNRIT